MSNAEPFNVCADGTCRTIKAQYWKNSIANFTRGGGYGATAVIVYAEDNDRPAGVEIEAERDGV